MEIRAIKTRIFRENEDLNSFIFKYVKKIPESSILVVASKIVALSEGRTSLDVRKKEDLIKQESDFTWKSKHVWLTIKDNTIMADAGIDESNADKKLILLPKDSFRTAQKLHKTLCRKLKIKNLGVIISDSGLLPLRNGVIGMALGYAGFQGVKSYIGQPDIFGRKFVYSKVNVADSFATAAAICMGEGRERQPLAVITDAPADFVRGTKRGELTINPKNDVYAPLFDKLN